MTQLVYALGAIAVLMLFTTSIQRSGLAGEHEMYLTETRTRMLGVARETVDRITRMELPFDDETNPDGGADGVYPYVTDPVYLTATSSFGGCSLASTYALSTCLDLDDFDGASVSDTADGIPVDITFEVVYVDTLTGALSASPTFAKMLTATVRSGALLINGDSVEVSYSRVFGYPNPIDFAKAVPALREGEGG